MLTCKQLTELGTAFTEGALDPATTRGVEAHLAGCQGCRTWLGQLGFTARVLRSLPEPEVTDEARAAALRQFDAWRASAAPSQVPAAVEGRPEAAAPAAPRRHAVVAPVAVAGLLALLVLVARRPSQAPGDWAVAGALALAAMLLAALARRLSLRFALTAVSASVAAALVRGSAGAWDLAGGLECLVTVLGAAAGLAAIGWLAARQRAEPATLGAWSVAGALAGDGALHVTCGAHGSLAHLALFHVGGVVLTAVLAGLVAWRARRGPVAA